MGKYCSLCGQLLNDASRFCTKCGTTQTDAVSPVSNSSPTPSYACIRTPEPIVTVVPVGMKTNGLLPLGYIMAVTPSRFIFAAIRQDLQRQAVELAKQDARQNGKGMFGRMSASYGANRHFHERYRYMTPEQILAETPGNFQLPASQIHQIIFSKSVTSSYGDYMDTSPATLRVISGMGEYRFEITQVVPEKELVPMLSAYYSQIFRQS